MTQEKTESQKLQYYKQIAIRSFKSVWDQYMFFKCSQEENPIISVDDFMIFIPNKTVSEEYVSEYWQQDYGYNKKGLWKRTIKQIETFIYEWEKELANLAIKKRCETYYTGKFQDKFQYADFLKLLAVQKCHYCDITEEIIGKLIAQNKMYKKKVTRGWTLEIDRKKPNLEYTYDNCVRCCYWCNSAKTDEFDDVEFAPIGHAIKAIWNERLNRK